MGNKDSKSSSSNADLLRNQIIFKQLALNKSEILQATAKKVWQDRIDRYLCDKIISYLFRRKNTLSFDEYNQFATVILNGTHYEKADVVLEVISENQSAASAEQVCHFIASTLSSCLIVESRFTSTNNLKSWITISNKSEVEYKFDRMTDYFMSLTSEKKTEYSSQDICNILVELDRFIVCALSNLLTSEVLSSSLFPRWQRLLGDGGKMRNQCSMLTVEEILFINTQLPADWQNEWRLLFSTKIHGESFSRLSGQITNQGPTLIIIEDKDGFMFGGFAPASWALSPLFSGDSTSFLFSLKPTMNVYSATNFNENFQYLNLGQQTLPNGLAMGGRLEYFGLWLDSDFGKGLSNDSCTTFRNYKRLSKVKDFGCAEVEVWGVGPPPPTAAELGERSVLDGNVEAKALLEMAGRKTYSDGIREQPDADDLPS